jgi:hypothetical protein
MLTSLVCRAEHFRSDWFQRWRELVLVRSLAISGGYKPELHRKHWEWCAIAQALWERRMLLPGRRGLGFAVGREPLPALFAGYGAEVVATDLAPSAREADRWEQAGQHATSLEQLYVEQLIEREAFDQRVRFQFADMSSDWEFEPAGFDFVWSSCSFEHLGSLEAGLDFVVRSSRLLRPWGVAVHTTEYNVSSNDETITRGETVLYRQRDIEDLDRRLRRDGYCLARPDLFAGQEAPDRRYDVPPYDPEAGRDHVKLLIGDFVATSVLLIVLA